MRIVSRCVGFIPFMQFPHPLHVGQRGCIQPVQQFAVMLSRECAGLLGIESKMVCASWPWESSVGLSPFLAKKGWDTVCALSLSWKHSHYSFPRRIWDRTTVKERAYSSSYDFFRSPTRFQSKVAASLPTLRLLPLFIHVLYPPRATKTPGNRNSWLWDERHDGLSARFYNFDLPGCSVDGSSM